MTHTEAAAKSNCGLAGRVDGEVCVLYANGSAFIAKDSSGELWRDVPLEDCERYHDWVPIQEAWFDRPLDWLANLWHKLFS